MRTTLESVARVLVVSAFALSGAGEAGAISEAKTTQGETYISGGVALGERAMLDRKRADFSLWVATAVKKTGSYLSDVLIRISDPGGKTVLDARLDGPWLLMNLKPGRYTVEARFRDQMQRKTTTINNKGDHREMLFYFDLEVETLPPGAKD
jgi:hypothetical protein